MLSKTLLAALLAVPALAAPLSGRADTPLVISLKAPDNVADINGATVTATIKNVGSESLTLVNDPNTVLSPFKTNTFLVSSNGNPATFQGFAVKADLLQVERTTIEAGQSVTVEHLLGGTYDLTTTNSSDFTVEAASKVLTLIDADGNLSSVEAAVESKKAGFKLADASVELRAELKASPKSGFEEKVEEGGLEKRAQFPGCSAAQQAKVKKGYTAAAGYTKYALSQLASSTGSAGTRYKTWFGARTEARHKKVVDHFTKINAQNWGNFKYSCTCTDAGLFAYVEFADYGHIHLCPIYWQHDVWGVQDSNAGTLIHESAHFTKNGQSLDHTYTPPNCKALAKSDPDAAVMNADSHEFFVESRDVNL